MCRAYRHVGQMDQAEMKGGVMGNKKKWIELCEQAADEQYPKKLAALILEINFWLEAKELRLIRVGVITQPAVEPLSKNLARQYNEGKIVAS